MAPSKERLCTDACGSCAGKYSPLAAIATAAEGNAVEYNGRVYRTLDGASPLDARTSYYLCQNYYLPLPSGWALAADNADSLYVTRSLRWGTFVLVVAGGRGYYTAAVESSAGSLSTSSGLFTSGSTYMTSGCNYLILISKTGSLPCTACPAGESACPAGESEPAPKRAHLLILVVAAQASTPIKQERLCVPTAAQVRVDLCI
jgi:hypothetical protein